jgi:hypothetical protein
MTPHVVVLLATSLIDPSMTSSSIENVRGYTSSLDLFNKIVVPTGGPAPVPP